jgi:hypothetical protein
MATRKRIPFDLSVIAEVFSLTRPAHCQHLTDWLSASYSLTPTETDLLEKVYAEMMVSSDYLNEEELKIRLIGPLFQIANIDDDTRVRVFYERPLSADVNGYSLSVVCDCMVASSTIFRTPTHPYFFLQDGPSSRFKKAKGEKRDPEAQMLIAMLAAQEANQDNAPVYGGFLIGSVWRLATLVGRDYCTSRQYFASQKDDLLALAFALRHLKTLLVNY